MIEKILHIQSPMIYSVPTQPPEIARQLPVNHFTVTFEPKIDIPLVSTEAVFLTLLDFSMNNVFDEANEVYTDNRPSNIFVNCSVSNNTNLINGKPSNVLDNIIIPDETIVRYQPTNPSRLNVNSLIGTVLESMSFWISDSSGNVIPVDGLVGGAKVANYRLKLLLEIY